MSNSPPRPGVRAAAGRRVTITDVAHAAGVSIAVVSYALNGRPGVSDATRRHVLQVADDLGWRPHAAARSMRSAQVAGIGLQVLDGSAATHSVPVGLAVAAGLRDHGDLHLSVDVVADRNAGARAIEEAWTESRQGSFVLLDLLLDDPRTRRADRVRAPVVAVTPPGLGTAGVTDLVWFDGAAAEQTARFLVDLGHRHLALLVRDVRVDVARALHAALLAATAGLRASVQVVEAPSATTAGTEAARLLTGTDHPTAVVTDGDITAMAVLEAARHRGLSVPWDVSVVAGADGETCRLVDPQLTAVARPWRELAPVLAARLAASGGIRRAPRAPGPPPEPDPADLGTDRTVVVPTERLVIRGTTAPPPRPGA